MNLVVVNLVIVIVSKDCQGLGVRSFLTWTGLFVARPGFGIWFAGLAIMHGFDGDGPCQLLHPITTCHTAAALDYSLHAVNWKHEVRGKHTSLAFG